MFNLTDREWFGTTQSDVSNRRKIVETSVPFSLNDKSIFITGGASGIGLGTCQRCLKEGARVIVADIQAPPQSVLEDGAIFFR